MRIWDVSPDVLCPQHLLGEHRELHGLWNILTVHGGQGGYARHPETLRWRGRTRALYERHAALVVEFERRGYRHRSELDLRRAGGPRVQDRIITPVDDQLALLTDKPCPCPLGGPRGEVRA